MTYRLIIKGTPEQAESELIARGLHTYRGVERISSDFNESIAYVDSTYDLTVQLQRWTNAAPRNAPYPEGSLLLWNEVSATPRAAARLNEREDA